MYLYDISMWYMSAISFTNFLLNLERGIQINKIMKQNSSRWDHKILKILRFLNVYQKNFSKMYMSGELFDHFYSYFRILKVSLSSINISVYYRRRFFLYYWYCCKLSYLFPLIKGGKSHSSVSSLCQWTHSINKKKEKKGDETWQVFF